METELLFLSFKMKVDGTQNWSKLSFFCRKESQ
jgi:hypothetical protein